jgi:AcrR family transcriptional regulator
VFTDGSVVTTPLDAVATAAGVSKATLFFHFGERRELLEALTGELYIELYHELGALDASTLRVFLEGYLGMQTDPRVRLLWALGDVLTADNAPLRDTAYAHLGIAIGLHLAGEGLPPDLAGHLTAVVAPATFLIARRAAFGQLEDDEVPEFLDHVDALIQLEG